MYERLEFCPKCNGNRKMVLSLGLMPTGASENHEDLLLYHYHCASCNAYVRSTSIDHEDFIIPGEMAVFSMAVYV